MRDRFRPVLTLAAIVAVVLAAPAAAAAAAGVSTDATQEDEEITPGQRLGGALGAQQTELDGELEERTFGLKVARAASDEAAADVVAERLEAVEKRLAELEQRREDLEAAREAGEIDRGEYAAEMAKLEAERASLERQVDRANATAAELPADVLEERGVDASAIQTLKDRADELGGQEVADVARSIAGEDVGKPVAEEKRPDHAGGPDDDDEDEEDDERGQGPDDPGPDGAGSGDGDAKESDADDGEDGSDAGASDRG